MQDLDPPAVPESDDTAARATGQRLVGLDIDNEHPVVAGHHGQDVQAIDTEELISARTTEIQVQIQMATRART